MDIPGSSFNYPVLYVLELDLRAAIKNIKIEADKVFQPADVDQLVGILIRYNEVLFRKNYSCDKSIKNQELKTIGCEFIKLVETLLQNQ